MQHYTKVSDISDESFGIADEVGFLWKLCCNRDGVTSRNRTFVTVTTQNRKTNTKDISVVVVSKLLFLFFFKLPKTLTCFHIFAVAFLSKKKKKERKKKAVYSHTLNYFFLLIRL